MEENGGIWYSSRHKIRVFRCDIVFLCNRPHDHICLVDHFDAGYWCYPLARVCMQRKHKDESRQCPSLAKHNADFTSRGAASVPRLKQQAMSQLCAFYSPFSPLNKRYWDVTPTTRTSRFPSGRPVAND